MSIRNAGLDSARTYASPSPRRANGSIDRGRLNVSTSTRVLSTVSDATRPGMGRRAQAGLPANVVDDQVEPVGPERVHGGGAEAASTVQV